MNEAKREGKYVWRKDRKMDGWGVKEQEMSDWGDGGGDGRPKRCGRKDNGWRKDKMIWGGMEPKVKRGGLQKG